MRHLQQILEMAVRGKGKIDAEDDEWINRHNKWVETHQKQMDDVIRFLCGKKIREDAIDCADTLKYILGKNKRTQTEFLDRDFKKPLYALANRIMKNFKVGTVETYDNPSGGQGGYELLKFENTNLILGVDSKLGLTLKVNGKDRNYDLLNGETYVIYDEINDKEVFKLDPYGNGNNTMSFDVNEVYGVFQALNRELPQFFEDFFENLND